MFSFKACQDEEILEQTISHEIFKKCIKLFKRWNTAEKVEIFYGIIEASKNMSLYLIEECFQKGVAEIIEMMLFDVSNNKKVIKYLTLLIRVYLIKYLTFILYILQENRRCNYLALKCINRLGKRGEDIYSEEGLNEIMINMERKIKLFDKLEELQMSQPQFERKISKIINRFYFTI